MMSSEKDELFDNICDYITDSYEISIKKTMDRFNQAGDVIVFDSVDSGEGWDTYFRGDSTNPEVGNDIWNLDWIYNNMERGNILKDDELISMIDEWADFEDGEEEELDEDIDAAMVMGAAAIASKAHTAYLGYKAAKKYKDKKNHDREIAEPSNWPNRFPFGDEDSELVTEGVSLDQTKIDTWFERDRSYVGLLNKDTEETIMEWWDEDVQQAVEDGFLDPKNWHKSAFEYVQSVGLNEEELKQVVAVVDTAGGAEEEESGFSTSGYFVARMEKIRAGVYKIVNKSATSLASWTDAENKAKQAAAQAGLPFVGYADHMGGGKFVTESTSTNEKCAACGHSEDDHNFSYMGQMPVGSKCSKCDCDAFRWNSKKESKMRRNEAHMKPEVFQSSGYEVTNEGGVTWWLPEEFGGDGSAADLEEYNMDTGKIEHIKNVSGWFGRMSASGYLDSTDWYFAKTEADVMKLLGDYQPGDFEFDESTLAMNVGNEPVQPFGDSDGPVLIEPDGTGTFSLVHHDEEDNEDILESGLSLQEAKKLLHHYNGMFVSVDFKESKNEGRNTMATVSGKRLVEAVARGRNPVQVVSSFLRSRLTEDTDVIQMLSGDDAGGKPLGGADTTNPMASASTKADIGPSSPIIPSAATAPIDGETGNADLAKKDDEDGVDSAIGSADGSADSEFMDTRESVLRRKMRVRRKVREALGLTKEGDRSNLSEERKKRMRKRKIREAIARIRARRGRRRFDEEEELPDFIKDKIASSDKEGGEEKKDTEKGDEEDSEEGPEKNFGGGEEKKDDTEKKESYYGIARRQEMESLNGSYQQMTPVGPGRRRGESVNETFRSMMLEAEGSETNNTATVEDLDKLPTEKDAENKEAPMESRRRSPRFQSRFRRRTVESETVFPLDSPKKEGFISDLTGGAVDDEDNIEKPESIRRLARRRIAERQRGRRNESVFGTRFEIGERVRVKGGGTGVVVEHADSSGTLGFGYQYMVQMDGIARSQRVMAADLSRA